MSAIWGAISLDNTPITEAVMEQMQKPLQEYKIDRFDSLRESDVIMGCGHQFVTEEAQNDLLPFYDEERDVFFTADCILDNRQELIEELELSSDIADGRLIYLSYLRWGEKLTDHLLGIFSFVFYLRQEKKVLIYTDHTSSRSIHYCCQKGMILFATTMDPILQVHSLPLCEKWLVGSETFQGANMLMFPELTPFKGLFQVMCGSYVVFTQEGIKKHTYWNPLKEISSLKLPSDKDYKEHFIQSFRECVSSVLRSSGETGITLSSGLDSTSVAAMAAPLLKKQDKKLYSFTSLPLEDYIGDEDPHYIIDESIGVKQMCDSYPNIEPSFVRCEGKSGFTNLEAYVNQMEMPVKSAVNLVWLDEIYRQAASNNCRIILKGQYGNSTISYGAILSRVYQELLQGHCIEAMRQLKWFKGKMHVTKRNIIRVVCGELKSKLVFSSNIEGDIFVKEKLVKKYKIPKIARSSIRKDGGGAMDSRAEHRNFLYAPLVFLHLGSYDTKLGLCHGLVLRDPTKDKRMIELCLQYPIKCFAGEGIERKMVRTYLDGIVPESIRMNVNRRGLQSADYVYRVDKDWETNKLRVKELFNNPQLYSYMDERKLKAFLIDVTDNRFEHTENEVARMLEICSFSLFLKRYEKGLESKIFHSC